MQRFSSFLQQTLKWIVPIVIIVTVLYSVTATHTEKEIVFVTEDNDGVAVVDELKAMGYVGNVSYAIALIAIELGFDIEAGGFELVDKMGPISFLAAVFSPEFKYVAVAEGLRKEEIANLLSKRLDWDEEERKVFSTNLPLCAFTGGEGYLFPGTYLIHKNEDPVAVRKRMENKLFDFVMDLSEEETKAVDILNTRQIITIASLIQREAAGKHDMRLISGVIWNRIFREMPLQIDATLQYVKADEEIGWWPPVRSDDKYLESPYNTYQNKGLPPGPIASPGPAAIEAALNPLDTSCLYYLHDGSRNIHCASTYATHKQNINYYLQ